MSQQLANTLDQVDFCVEVLKHEGGIWEPVSLKESRITPINMQMTFGQFHAYKFKSGRIWDIVNGWRDYTQSAVADRGGRTFETGAYRDTEQDKLDYEAFLSPLVLRRYAEYMHKNRTQSDGNIREGDNWQKGIPLKVYWKSAWRHFMDVWTYHRTTDSRTPSGESMLEEALCALLFNVQGYLFELLKKRSYHADRPIAPPLSTRIDT